MPGLTFSTQNAPHYSPEASLPPQSPCPGASPTSPHSKVQAACTSGAHPGSSVLHHYDAQRLHVPATCPSSTSRPPEVGHMRSEILLGPQVTLRPGSGSERGTKGGAQETSAED